MKYKILAMLRDNMPGYTSGEALSRQLNVTRTAVWKYVNELRQEGYEIDSVSRRGYRLISGSDIMNSYELSANLGTSIIGRNVIYFGKVDSTNIEAKKIAADCQDGTAIVAGYQTAGRGRLGRKWESPEGTGIYLSVIIKPDIPPEKVQVITLAASVAVAAALKETAGIDAGIKWPNDIVLNGKKVCGILTEMNSEMERVNYIILGIGVNFSQKAEDFPQELRDRAISVADYLSGTEPSASICRKSALVRAILVKLDKLYKMLLDGDKQEIITLWKSMSATLGREVSITGKDISYTGKAVDVTDDGRLVILCSDGTRRDIVSGEVSVRGLLGYV